MFPQILLCKLPSTPGCSEFQAANTRNFGFRRLQLFYASVICCGDGYSNRPCVFVGHCAYYIPEPKIGWDITNSRKINQRRIVLLAIELIM